MEVTKSNFKDLLPEIEKTIKNCTFLSIDCELTGLYTVSTINAFDTPKQYYEKIRTNCKDFLVIQYGLSAFRFDENTQIFKQQSYNFYIFRSPINKNIPDQRFLCQSSSIEFLISQGFDFNKLFKNGIPYLNIVEETKYREQLEEKKNHATTTTKQSHTEILSIPEDAQPFIDNALKLYDDFLETGDLELELPKCNGFIRRLMYQVTAEKYENKIILQTRTVKNKDRILFAIKYKNKEEHEEIEKKHLQTEFNVLEDFIGFTKVLRLVVDSGKIVVGHNLSLDFIHTIDKFLTPLPEDYEEFKQCAHSLFSKILDTKYMSTSEPFNEFISSTVLNDLLTTLRKEPFEMPVVEIEEGGQGYSLDDDKQHEAGYDAYITGLCLLSMWNYLGLSKNNSCIINFDLLNPYINKIYLMALQDSQYIHLGGEDLKPSRDHVFYLTFPKDWKLNNIVQLFSPFGNVYVAWIDETSAYVGLQNRSQFGVALNTLSQSDTYSIMSYTKRQLQLAGMKSGIQASPSVPSTRRKRVFDSTTTKNMNNKKTKTVHHFGQGSFSNRFAPIMEDVDAESNNETPPTSHRKVRTKTFTENNSWE